MDLDKARSLAEASVLKAGRELNESRNQWAVAERVEGHDVKIAADHQAEALIAGLLHAGSGLSVFSEEAGWIGATADKTTVEPYWVLDPLDGSANYLRGVPLCCVSLALVKGIEPLLGVIYDFNRNELFTGIASKGAWLNGVPMTVSNIVRPDEALLTTGFPVAMDYESDALREYVDAVRAYRKVRSLGTAATMLAYVAAGRFDIYRERSVRFWDVAAGIAMVLGAGGQVRVENFDDDPAGKLDLTAYNGVLNL